MTSLSSGNLRTITDTLSLDTLQILSSIDLPELTFVGELKMSDLPNMQGNSLLQTLTQLSSLSVINTGLSELEPGFRLETLDTIVITNNPYLNRINLQPYNITGGMTISSNGRNLEVSMPNVQVAQNLSFANCSSISTPSLHQCFGLNVISNTISEFTGVPLLREINTSLAFVANSEMTRIALPELRTVSGAFLVANNTKLEALDQLYSLARVDGAVDLQGPLENVAFQSLERVSGIFNVNSTLDVSCDQFDQYYIDGLVADYSCTRASDISNASMLSRASTTDSTTLSNGTASSSGNGDTSGDQSQGLSTGARIGIGVGVGGGVGALIGGLIGLWFHRRKKARKASADEDILAEKDGSGVDRAYMLGNDRQKFEMEQPMGEMGFDTAAQELPAKHGMMELDCNASTKGSPGIESRHEMPANEKSSKTDRKLNEP